MEEPLGLEGQKPGLQLVVDLVDTFVEDQEVLCCCWTWGHLGLQTLEAVASEALVEVTSA